jgi:putative transposase
LSIDFWGDRFITLDFFLNCSKNGLSQPHPEHKAYLYLLRGADIMAVNQVWSTDITYQPILKGHFYLVAIMDWFSPKVLSWQVSSPMDVQFALAALEVADISNSDQGAQFTAQAFTESLPQANVPISMDGRGRCHDNIFITGVCANGRADAPPSDAGHARSPASHSGVCP